MSDENDKDLDRTEELFRFLQGEIPKGYTITRGHVPKLTADQAWTVVWYLGNQYWQVTDRVERCDVCGALYHTSQEGRTLDYGRKPFHFCEFCMDTEEFNRKQNSRLNPERQTANAK